jgi:hypothetical protein
MAGPPLLESVPRETWQKRRVGAKEACANLDEAVAWKSLADRPHGGRLAGHMAFLAATSARAPPHSLYKSPHSHHGKNQIRVEVISFQVLPLPYIIE